MEPSTKAQIGSPSHDRFKFLHKQELPDSCWALDIDLVLVEKFPIPFIVAFLDLKMTGDRLQFTQAITYKQHFEQPLPYYVPVFVIEADDLLLLDPPSLHRFSIWELIDCDYRPNPPTKEARLIHSDLDWEGYKKWEVGLRAARITQMKRWMNKGPWGHYSSIGEYLEDTGAKTP